MRLLIRPTKSGIRAVMPVIDTDPNNGTSVGAMPVWVELNGSSTIGQIHALAVAYNTNVGVTGQYQYFLFPEPESSFVVRLGLSQRFDREAVTEYTTSRFRGRALYFNNHIEFSKDSSKRFFGVGADTPKTGESSYTMDTIGYRIGVGVPLWEESPFHATLTNQLQANDVSNGGVEWLPDLGALYPGTFRDVSERHTDISLRGSLEYDTRDSPITTSRGSNGVVFLEGAHKDALSEYDYHRYGLELKTFHPFGGEGDSEPATITALRLRFENVQGTVPFWLLSSLGGKYSHRAYGEGRFVDHSMTVFGGEQRIRLYATKVGKTSASFWLDPFFAFGTVATQPELFQMKYLRPVVGAALRVVCRPSIVGSADFGMGQEGLKVFLDVNYTF